MQKIRKKYIKTKENTKLKIVEREVNEIEKQKINRTKG